MMIFASILLACLLARCTSAWTNTPRSSGQSPLLAAIWNAFQVGQTADHATAVPDLFRSIEPSDDLKWVPCSPPNATNGTDVPLRFECAKLLVPFDYSNPDPSAGQFALAVIRILSSNKTDYKGPLFFNFGGPGASGTLLLPIVQLQLALDAGYDLVSWDPRAVGSTFPPAACFANEAARRRWWDRSRERGLFLANDSFVALQAENSVQATGCEEYSSQVLPYLGTVFTARDLRRLVERYGHSTNLNYFGLSYGTLLGATFASMFPDQVGRMILDGVIDPTLGYSEGIAGVDTRDADSALEDFFDLCFRAGPSRCDFWFDSPTAIKNAFFELDNKIHARPIPVGSAFVLNWALWREWIFNTLYRPSVTFPLLGTALALAYNDSLPSLTNTSSLLPIFEPTPSPVDPNTGRSNGIENVALISCSDRPRRQYKDEQEFLAFLSTRKGEFFGQLLTGRSELWCDPLDLNVRETFNGSFTNVRTAAPILFVSPFHDPITPLSQAISASPGFIGSSILISNITGHTTVVNPTKCVLDHLTAYLRNATLPVNGTICQPEILPFNLFPNGTLAPENLGQPGGVLS